MHDSSSYLDVFPVSDSHVGQAGGSDPDQPSTTHSVGNEALLVKFNNE